MSWLVVGIESGVFWTTEETKVVFRGRELTLRPETDKWAPDVITEYEGTESAALRTVRQFLSSVAWSLRGRLREIGVTGGSHPIHYGVGRSPGLGHARLINPSFRLDYLPDPADPRARLAMALYREALGLNSDAYQFLGFFKILNILHARGADHGRWINKTVDRLTEERARKRVEELRHSEPDIGQYFWTSGRCAIAHAYAEPMVDPEDPDDLSRLQKDLPVVKALAEYLIEYELGVKSSRTIYQEHLYELEGFRSLLGSETVSRLKQNENVPLESLKPLPKLSIRMRDHQILPAFERLIPYFVAADQGCVLLDCVSEDRLVVFRVALSFSEERLRFDAERGVLIADDGTAKPYRCAADHARLIRSLVLNGQLEIWNGDSNTLLGRTDPNIPLNIDTSGTIQLLDRQIERLEAMAAERHSCQIPQLIPQQET